MPTKKTETTLDDVVEQTEQQWSYTPFGESQAITLTLERAKHFLATPTKSGKLPTKRDLVNFLQTCATRRLNPWTRDAFLIGYDDKSGARFETIVAYQALAKRAEFHAQFDGIDSGIIVQRLVDDEPKTIELLGSFASNGDVLVGAWARVHRKDRAHMACSKINRKAFDKGHGRWRIDPHGMLEKCAKAAAMREAFPSDIGGMYVAEELKSIELSSIVEATEDAASRSEQLAKRIAKKKEWRDHPMVGHDEAEAAKAIDTWAHATDLGEALANCETTEQVAIVSYRFTGLANDDAEKAEVGLACKDREDELTEVAAADGQLFETNEGVGQ